MLNKYMIITYIILKLSFLRTFRKIKAENTCLLDLVMIDIHLSCE